MTMWRSMTTGCIIINVTDTTFLFKAQKITDLRYVNPRGQAYKVVYRNNGFITK